MHVLYCYTISNGILSVGTRCRIQHTTELHSFLISFVRENAVPPCCMSQTRIIREEGIVPLHTVRYPPYFLLRTPTRTFDLYMNHVVSLPRQTFACLAHVLLTQQFDSCTQHHA